MTCTISVERGDITRLEVDAIVNAANETLLGGGGVDGAIHRAAGPGLLDECRTLGGCPTGDARITGGYDLAAQHVIHTVGPVWKGGSAGEDRLLTAAYRSCLDLVRDHALSSVAFPAISTGVYGFPKGRAANLALLEVRRFLGEPGAKPEHILFSAHSDGEKRILRRACRDHFKSYPPVEVRLT